MKHLKLISVIFSVLLIVGGGIGFYYMNSYFNSYKVHAMSTLVKEVPKTTKKAETKHKDLKTIIHNNQKNVVQITVETDNGTVLGSGFLYNSKGDVITNAHVVTDANKITVKTADAQNYKGELIGIGDKTDIAVVRVSALARKDPMKLNKDKKADVGDEVLALGSPLGLQNTVTTGIISGVDRDLNIEPYSYHHVYQISAPITHGNSGGPLIDRNTGEVIGINAAGTDSGTIGFSIPIHDVYEQLKDWSDHPSDVWKEKDQTSEESGSLQDLSNKDMKDGAEYLVNYFYESLNSNDYVTAYSLLGSQFHDNVSYDSFRKGYLNTISTSINDMKSSVDGKKVNITVIIEAQERTNDQSNDTALYKCNYKIGYENDQMKILSGSGSKIE